MDTYDIDYIKELHIDFSDNLFVTLIQHIEENNQDILRTTDCFIIDEGQFFVDLVDFCKKWSDCGKIIVIAGLSGDTVAPPPSL
mgnify:CR=1 FL=1